MAIRVDQAERALAQAIKLGARAVLSPETTFASVGSRAGGLQSRAAIHAFGDVRHSLISYEKGAALVDFFPENSQAVTSHKGRFCQTIDHVTVNLPKGELDRVAKFYSDVFGFSEVRYFDIRTAKSGLISKAMRSANGRITMPFNEPTNDKSQIQEFLNTFHGPGVQHIALHVSSILLALEEYEKQGLKFLTVPATYYEAVPERVPHVNETMADLQRHSILVDGTDKGYLLQIFSENLVGPLFYEFIQRKGDNGFGEGNFRALFESIERDQERRGVI